MELIPLVFAFFYLCLLAGLWIYGLKRLAAGKSSLLGWLTFGGFGWLLLEDKIGSGLSCPNCALPLWRGTTLCKGCGMRFPATEDTAATATSAIRPLGPRPAGTARRLASSAGPLTRRSKIRESRDRGKL